MIFGFQRQPPIVASQRPVVGGFGIPRDTQIPSELDPADQKEKRPTSFGRRQSPQKILSKQRVFIEHINRRCKIFRIVKDVYRGKHKHYSLTWNLVAALVNLRYDCI